MQVASLEMFAALEGAQVEAGTALESVKLWERPIAIAIELVIEFESELLALTV